MERASICGIHSRSAEAFMRARFLSGRKHADRTVRLAVRFEAFEDFWP